MAYAGGASEFGVRPTALGRRGMVASANTLATQAGLRMLAAGGNAVDAAVATAAAITVVEPYFSAVGGIGIAVLTLPTGETRTLNFLGRSPARARPEMFTARTQDLGPLAPMVPGNVAGWARLHGEFGSLPIAQVLEPAIELADGGIPVTRFDFERTALAVDRLTPHPDAARTYLNDGRPYAVGELLRQPGLALTLRTIAQEGWMTFYEGRIAQTIATYMVEHGGLISEEDLQRYPDSLHWEAPVTAMYRGYELRTTPPPSSAVQILQTLRILEAFNLADLEHLGPAHVAVVAEAIRLARMDAAAHVADPLFVEVPLAWMLSDERIRELRAEVSRRMDAMGGRSRRRVARATRNGGRRRTAERIRRARSAPERSTTHLAAADASGLAVNITQTLGSSYGSGVVIGRTGIAMNNGHHWCTLIPGDPKELAPGKRRESPSSPMHVFGLNEVPVGPTQSFGIDPLGPAHVSKGGRLAFMIGTPGSYGIPQTTAQMIINLIDFDKNIQDAIAAPRFRWKDDVGDPLPPKVLLLEGRFPPAVRKALAARGYRLEILEDWSARVGGGQGIVFRDDRWMMGGADPRRNGYAMGW
ncbi:MAG TPA: gamma-glutamyltransferase family protein [bacterium]|nr:gamma-glutamyltransferase family protein [bacterium]